MQQGMWKAVQQGMWKAKERAQSLCGNLRPKYWENETWMTTVMETKGSQSQSVPASIYTDPRWAKLPKGSWMRASIPAGPCIWFNHLACGESVCSGAFLI